jgi:predicted component of type VI protein secretion system
MVPLIENVIETYSVTGLEIETEIEIEIGQRREREMNSEGLMPLY